jgi:hypothetical protein
MTTMSHYTALRVAFAVVTLTFAAGTSRAAGEGAEELIRRSVEARRAGDDEGALRLLRQAYADGQTPHAAGQLGLCEQAMGLWAEAEVHVIVALKTPNDPWVHKNHAVLMQDLDVIRSHLGRVEVHGDPAGARVMINGKDVGALPLAEPVRVAAGVVEVTVAAPGFVTARKSVHVEAGQYEHVTLAAVPAATPPPPPAASPPPAPAEAVSATPPTTLEATRAAPETSAVWRPRAKWIAWGAGVVALGVGVYGTAENAHLVSAFNDNNCRIDAGNAVSKSTGLPTSDCTSRQSDYESATHLAVGAFIGAALLGAAGTILWLTEPQADAARTAWTACRPALGARFEPWLGCSLRF